MASNELVEIIKRTELLTPDERLELIAHLAESVRQEHQAPVSRRAWSEIAGAAAYPMVGEDAQAWVTRSRREDDEHRERQLGR